MAANKNKTTGKEVGDSGVTITGGVITGEEYNPKLTSLSALKIYDEMRRSDATVKASLRAVKLPIKSAEYRIDPADDDENRDVADVVEECLFRIVDWKQFLNEALTHLDFGFTVFEMVFEPRMINGTLRMALVKLGFRKQTTIQAWEMENGKPGVRQQISKGTIVSIPLEKLVVFTNDQEGDNYQGISLLRAAYKHWYIKDKLYRIDAVGHERHALGVLEIITPKNALESDKKKLRRVAKNLRANESSYIEHPEGYTTAFMDMQAHSLKDVEPSINHHDRQILLNVLAQFLALGSAGGAGSRATSEDHSRLFELAIKDTADYIVQVIQNTVVKTIVDLNFTDREYPKLAIGNISDENIPVVSAAIKVLVDAGVLHPRSADENNVRKMIGWGEVDEEELDEAFATAAEAKAAAAALKTANADPVKDDNQATPPADEDKTGNKVLKAARKVGRDLTRFLYGGKS